MRRRTRQTPYAALVFAIALALAVLVVVLTARAPSALTVFPRGEAREVTYEYEVGEWKARADWWKANQDPEGAFGARTQRYADARRILSTVSGRLESLRRRQARGEDPSWVLRNLERDRLEWRRLVEDSR